MKKIYIAGKISGECETPELMQKCIDKFNNYGKSISFGRWYRPVNNFSSNQDITLKFTHGLIINFEYLGKDEWSGYMKRDISVLVQCDEIHMLSDWKDSKGAKIEHQLALDLGIKIVYVQIPN